MRIAVIGAGLPGVTTACFLARAGHEVLVLDRREGPGLETSFANGGMLTPSQAAPWNTPGIALQLLKWIGREDSPFLLKFSQLPALTGWGTAFLRYSGMSSFRRNQLKNAALGFYSLQVLRETRQQLGIQYDQSTCGTMKIYRSGYTLDTALAMLKASDLTQLPYQVLDQAGVTRQEPALSPIRDTLAGGIYFPEDEAGDAYLYCRELAAAAVRFGASFRYGTELTGLVREKNRISAVSTRQGDIEADLYILAAGSFSPRLARTARLALPVYPVKGYSLTIPTSSLSATLPVLPVIDELRHVAVTPLGQRLRVAGKAELAGYDTSVNEHKVKLLLKFFGQIYPQVGSQVKRDLVQVWSGLRPYTSDGVPILGGCEIENLLLNTGHGHLGWTLAAGSARLITDLICGKETALDLAPYLLSRFH